MPDERDRQAVERQEAMAAIPAKGLLRDCRAGGASGPLTVSPGAADSSQNCLEWSEPLRLPVPTGYVQDDVRYCKTRTCESSRDWRCWRE